MHVVITLRYLGSAGDPLPARCAHAVHATHAQGPLLSAPRQRCAGGGLSRAHSRGAPACGRAAPTPWRPAQRSARTHTPLPHQTKCKGMRKKLAFPMYYGPPLRPIERWPFFQAGPPCSELKANRPIPTLPPCRRCRGQGGHAAVDTGQLHRECGPAGKEHPAAPEEPPLRALF
jgi:hypothetical protein